MCSVYIPLFWRATGLTNLVESCSPDKTTGNKHCTRLKKDLETMKRVLLYNPGNREICKTCGPPKQQDIQTAHDREIAYSEV